MGGDPVPGNISAPGDPDVVMRHDMVKKPDKASEAGRAAISRQCKPTDIIFGVFSLLIKHIKRVSQIACKLITIVESCAVANRMSFIQRVERSDAALPPG